MAPSTNGTASSIYSTPSRTTRDRDKFQFPESSNPSPGPLKHSASSTSTSSSSTHLQTTSTSATSLAAPAAIVTVESLLKHHASSSDPKSAALETVVAERNSLSAQNAQLWKLIEKQRAGYSQILKELDRIRGERDGYKSKLAALTGTTVEKSSRSSDRTVKMSFAESTRARGSSDSQNTSSLKASQGRHNTVDDASTPRGSQHPAIQSTRSQDPLAPSVSDTELQSNNSYSSGASRPTTPPRPPPASAPSAFSTPSSARTNNRPSPTPLVLPPRNESPAIPSSAISINAENAPFSRQVQARDDYPPPIGTTTPQTSNGARQQVYPTRKSSLLDSSTSLSSASSVGIPNLPGSATVATPTPHNYSSHPQAPTPVVSQKEERQNGSANHSFAETPTSRPTVIAVPASNTSQQQRPAANRANSLDVQGPAAHLLSVVESRPYLSRDSRITLPDEARQYIANMTDSPVPSPRVDTFSTKSAVAGPPDTSSLASTNSERPSEFLDLEDDEDGEDEARKNSENTPGGIRLMVQQEPNTPTNSTFSRSAQSLELPMESTPGQTTPARPRREVTRVGGEDFPMPPHSGTPARQQSLQPEGYPGSNFGQDASPAKQLQTSTDASNSASQPQDSVNSVRGYNSAPKSSSGPLYDMKHPSPQPTPSPHAVSASFRALPLLSTDLPYTSIQVSHSFVRPNDRGKEVLSFIVSVNPGNGKSGWKVEKMYSDVLSLDQRVRSSVGKGVGKKIANLPEGKLWKDHAPARVDQRKAVLEQYLQSLIHLPIKTNDEVIAFFTSDIVRETKQPVMQIGHKEGYLTKRGKNFGGWKTRFFVLQGPVLEYYDCRGGQHLGSITITGAQIARQHRTERSTSTDEENEYRHAFLIVEAKKGPGGSHPRHVLCAESDEERDAWVELLVRYYTGTYNEDLVFNPTSGISSANSNSVAAQGNYPANSPTQTRTSSDIPLASASRKQPTRPPISLDDPRSSSPSRSVDPSPIDRSGPGPTYYDAQMRRVASERGGLPSSLPDPSPLSSVPPIQLDPSNPVERAASEMGHYPDLQEIRQVPGSAQPRQRSPERHRPRDVYEGRHTNFSSTNLASAGPLPDRAPSPEKPDLSKVKISGPMNGTPIPSGFKFGKDNSSEQSTSSAERREKAKSRSFWGFGKTSGGDKQPSFTPRAVFAIPLEDSLDVAQICGLPAIVFRCIQYLEAKKADQEEGIYRLSGSSAVIKSLKDRFNTEGDVDLLASDEYWDPHAIAGLLKSFLRELPASILTREMHLRFLAVIGEQRFHSPVPSHGGIGFSLTVRHPRSP
ncbi:signal transducer [Coprinopsis cinerea AmutBmut pab1-1]|nr:signal transducer [Coprinopsis cinerea AmutBmut pab1-1]